MHGIDECNIYNSDRYSGSIQKHHWSDLRGVFGTWSYFAYQSSRS